MIAVGEMMVSTEIVSWASQPVAMRLTRLAIAFMSSSRRMPRTPVESRPAKTRTSSTEKRIARPAELVPGTVRVITARMDYLPAATPAGWQDRAAGRLADPALAVVSLYARGRDYHKVLRQRLQSLSDRIAEHLGPFGHRVFTDSAPVLEAELAAQLAVEVAVTSAADRRAGRAGGAGDMSEPDGLKMF